MSRTQFCSVRTLALWVVLLAFGFGPGISSARSTPKRHTLSKSTKKGGGKGGKKKRRRRRRPVGPRLYSGVPLKVLETKTTTLAPGVTYTLKTISKNKWRVGIVHADLDQGYRVALIKAKEKAVGFERTEDLVHRLDSVLHLTAVAAVNANYWRAGIGTAIGAAVCGGELVAFDNYKPWSRCSVRQNGSFQIEVDSMYATVLTPHDIIPLAAANSRSRDSGVVLYNRYFGPFLPPVDTTAPTDSLAPRKVPDSTLQRLLAETAELFYETDEDGFLTDTLGSSPRSEEHTLKCVAIMLDTPMVNVPIRCVVRAMSPRIVPIPRNGIVLSFPRTDSAMYRRFHTGDTLRFMYSLGDGTDGPLTEMLMAGPRLVRNGRVSVETERENFHRKSFIAGSHARTAFGYSKDQKQVILVTVDRPMGTRKAGRPGIGLSDLARILVSEGANDALNLDGGSSTTLVVNGATVFPDTGKEFSRHVASCVVILKRN